MLLPSIFMQFRLQKSRALFIEIDLGPLHMSPVDRAGSVTEMKLVSVHMVIFSPLSEMKNLKKW